MPLWCLATQVGQLGIVSVWGALPLLLQCVPCVDTSKKTQRHEYFRARHRGATVTRFSPTPSPSSRQRLFNVLARPAVQKGEREHGRRSATKEASVLACLQCTFVIQTSVKWAFWFFEWEAFSLCVYPEKLIDYNSLREVESIENRSTNTMCCVCYSTCSRYTYCSLKTIDPGSLYTHIWENK